MTLALRYAVRSDVGLLREGNEDSAYAGPHLLAIADSRASRLREGDLYQITRDHTLVQSLLDEGRISADEAATHPQRSLILRALDSRTDAEPDLSLREALPRDRYLLCSDGLSDVVTEETLHRTLADVPDPDEAVIQLVELANRAGGPDNITCIVADVVDTASTRGAPSEISVV